MTDDELELIMWLGAQGYRNLRVLEDGTVVGTIDLLFTRSLIVGANHWGWEHRYCYKDRELAVKAAAALKSCDDPPLPGYVAERH